MRFRVDYLRQVHPNRYFNFIFASERSTFLQKQKNKIEVCREYFINGYIILSYFLIIAQRIKRSSRNTRRILHKVRISFEMQYAATRTMRVNEMKDAFKCQPFSSFQYKERMKVSNPPYLSSDDISCTCTKYINGRDCDVGGLVNAISNFKFKYTLLRYLSYLLINGTIGFYFRIFFPRPNQRRVSLIAFVVFDRTYQTFFFFASILVILYVRNIDYAIRMSRIKNELNLIKRPKA